MGFRNLWEYCVEALGLCQTTAWRRFTAARVCRRFPAAFDEVARGDLHVSVLAELNRHLTESNAQELFALCRRKSFRAVQELLAARFPKPDERDSIRRAPLRTPSLFTTPTVPVHSGSTAPRATSSNHATSEKSAKPTSSISDVGNGDGPDRPSLNDAPTPERPRPAHRQVEPLSLDRFAVRFTADAEFLGLLEEVRGLSAHREPSGDLLSLLKAGLRARQQELLKQRFAVGRKPRAAPKRESETARSPSPAQDLGADEPASNEQHIPADVARQVYERDAGQCTFVSAEGRPCSARRQLELDHVVPRAVGGEPTVPNLRLRCRAHNQLAARRYFGRGYMSWVMTRVAARKRTVDSRGPT